MRSLLCDELYDMGLRVIEAANGEEAVRCVIEHKPDVVLTDLKMPAGGLDYVAALRALVPDTPVLLMTAFGDRPCRSASQRILPNPFESLNSKPPSGGSFIAMAAAPSASKHRSALLSCIRVAVLVRLHTGRLLVVRQPPGNKGLSLWAHCSSSSTSPRSFRAA